MPRIRSIKPGFFANEQLADLQPDAQLLFIGLWTLADREGRLEDRPRRIQGELFRYRNVDVDALLNELQKAGFVRRYTAEAVDCIQVVNFGKHQRPNKNELASDLPPEPSRPTRRPIKNGRVTNQDTTQDVREGKGVGEQEGERREEGATHQPARTARQARSVKFCDEEFLNSLQAEPAYQRLNVKHVHAKMVAWCKHKGKQPTQGRLINWLNGEDQPLEGNGAKAKGNAYVGAPSPPLPESEAASEETADLTVDEILAIVAEHEKANATQ